MKDWRKEQKQIYDEIMKRSKSGHQYIYDENSVETLDKIIPKKGRILDVGCGSGQLETRLKDREWYGIDISPKSVRTAKKFCKVAVTGDATKRIPFHSNYFDYVVAIAFFHHTPGAIRQSLKEIRRVLKHNGKVIIIDHDKSDTHTRLLHEGPLRLVPSGNERVFYPDQMVSWLKDEGFDASGFEMISIYSDQQALKSSIFVRMLKVPLLLLFSKLGKKTTGNFLISARVVK
jgi:ubiquinone/menaquinone biosynthesis C-methylase UbiE